MLNKKVTCKRCGYLWTPKKRIIDIVICAKCKSPYWNKPRRGEE